LKGARENARGAGVRLTAESSKATYPRGRLGA
jgi:hypothetical protein